MTRARVLVLIIHREAGEITDYPRSGCPL